MDGHVVAAQLVALALSMLERLDGARRAANLAFIYCNPMWCWLIQSHSIYQSRE
jgi:hypothetical protein